ncbi:MAG: alpha/beta fold hydrolase [Pseudomonadota bacterium]
MLSRRPARPGARHGIATYAYDQRGFGGAPDRGRWAGTPQLAADVASAAALLRGRYPGVPLYLLGESMGGAVAILAASGRGRRAGARHRRRDPGGAGGVGRQTMSMVERVRAVAGRSDAGGEACRPICCR